MGLDTVELVMAVEREFDVCFHDADLEKVRTPGDLIALIGTMRGYTDHAVCLSQRGFNRLRRSCITHLGIKRSEFKLDTNFNLIIPTESRRSKIRDILADLSISKMPDMERPRWLANGLSLAAMGIGAIAAIRLKDATPSSSSILEFLKQGYYIWGAIVAVVAGVFFALITRSACEILPSHAATVEGLTRWIVAQNPPFIGAPPGEWSRELIAEKVRVIVIEQLGISEKQYREDARFIEDLGVD